MKTIKEEADELIEKFVPYNSNSSDYFIETNIAIVCVELIVKSSPSMPIMGDGGTFGEDIELSTEYWNNVLTELKSRL